MPQYPEEVVTKLVQDGSRYVHSIDKEVLDFLSQLNVIFGPTADVYCAGGYPTFLLGLTNTYEDVDFFVTMPLSKEIDFKTERKLYEHMPNIEWDISGIGYGYSEGLLRHVRRTFSIPHWNFNVIFDYQGLKSLEQLLNTFDIILCANGFYMKTTGEIVSLSLLDSQKWEYPPYMCGVDGKLIKPDSRKHLQSMRIEKYRKRFVCPTLQKLSLMAL